MSGDALKGFGRIRIGVGRPLPGMDQVDFVLLDFSHTGKAAVEDAIAKVGEAVPLLLKERLAAAMNRYNQRESASP